VHVMFSVFVLLQSIQVHFAVLIISIISAAVVKVIAVNYDKNNHKLTHVCALVYPHEDV
jgi:hypothetical protein